MLKKSVLLLAAFTLVLGFASCKKKEEAQPPQQMAPQQTPSIVMPQGGPQVTVPPAVQSSWKAVVLVVENKATGKTSDATVNIGSDYAVPGSTIKVEVVSFLPDFKMSGSEITSVSNDPNNPAAQVRVSDNGKEIFKGWLYSKYPAIHPFQNDKYGITLKKGVKK
ncbi:MAG: DUF2155 domain-containing protein [Nitrospiraceae bacterium]|nr:DUF2155 domain-containing protein [Nitrospiraceae bacterium]